MSDAPTPNPADEPQPDPAGTVRVPERVVAPPASISPAAQQALGVRQPPPDFPAPDDIDAWRQLVADLDAAVVGSLDALTSSVRASIEDTRIAGVPCFVADPGAVRERGEGKVCLDLHGGGLYQGGGALARALTGLYADVRRIRTIGVDYRMPPDHPYPAALDDCVAVYRALLDDTAAEDIVVSGASAGGNLATAMILRARDEGLPLPSGVLLTSPEVDLTESGDTFTTLDGIDVLGSLMPVNRLYAAGHDLSEPLLSPLFGDFAAGFPPTYLQSGTRDLYLSNTVRMHRVLRNAGVRVECFVFEARPHLGFGGLAPEDFETIQEADRFLESIL